MTYLLAVDQGTTSTRAILYDTRAQAVASASRELQQFYPGAGWVEHDADQLWRDSRDCVREAMAKAGVEAKQVAGLGITNQRETVVVWDRTTGEAIHPAIVWQDRRTTDFCKQHHSAARDGWLQQKTGLLLDPYFSATKVAWILDHVEGARARAEAGELAFGTVDSWLIYKLTGGRVHATDATNASRTLLFNIRLQRWDEELLEFFRVPRAVLPDVHDSAYAFGSTDSALFGGPIAVAGVAGDQQAATVGQACFEPGMIKSTYGTGCFMVLNLGSEFVRSKNRLLTTTAYRLNGQVTYGLEGSIFIAGAAVQWLRDAARLIRHAADTEDIARSIPDTGGVYLVPAFTGLGAPYWDPEARGAVLGLTRDTGMAHIVRAALESVCYQTRDLIGAMREDAYAPSELRVDGGMVVNDWVVQFLADILGIPVVRPSVIETTALGAAFLAGLQTGVYDSLDTIAQLWESDKRVSPQRPSAEADRLYEGWQRAVERVRSG
ncbi:glycerol kinase GlpK [Algiphilus sp.]|uniref:glycerol kinase GlpK n=1 Tax=Algiphilus sp. TaxID=1872431 RepID=UPI001CA6EB5E|nr:glycerol kinase GlpK [Algiphilus sp.]MBY8964113.1 glycerol kinase GlpK [Algiphilus acroporae]MCI5062278.1 glycerol kinase GlpK [Algiphilus sp.]MCI5104602.1 glycerol kinase GlpK [Algiphilus sp.]MCR9090442.1 glycerol kinase GlpK [Pseudomonadota bacterium]